MPTYGYECTACKDDFEVFQSIKDAVLTTCQKCGGALRKRIYPVGIAFKGPGFYVNDYSNSKPSAAKSSSDTASAATDKGTEASTSSAASVSDSKPAESKATDSTPVASTPAATAT